MKAKKRKNGYKKQVHAKKKCGFCNVEFRPSRAWQDYCQTAHRLAAWRKRKAEESTKI